MGKQDKNFIWILMIVAVLMLAASCRGGADPAPHFQGDNNDAGLVNNLLPAANPADVPQPQPISGSFSGAPLGVNEEYGVEEISDTIVTRLVDDGTSSVRGSSQVEEDRLFWIAVVARGEEPIEGNVSPPVSEGDLIDLYMRYQVFENQLEISRNWYMEAAGLDYIEPNVVHPQAGVYEAIFEFTVPYGSANTEAVFKAYLAPPRATSVFVVPDQGDAREIEFAIEDTEVLAAITYPSSEGLDAVNDEQGGGGGCMPDVTVTFNGTEVYVESTKDLSNVVLEFEDTSKHQKWDDLNVGPTGTFYGTGSNAGKTIIRVWVKSGCNASGDGPGYGEMFEPQYEELGMAQFGWEDLLTNGDYDYNDFVGRLRATEIRNSNNEAVQVQLTVKAVARAAGYDSDWQFNIGAAFPDNTVYAIVNQYYADGTRNGDQRIYKSLGGASIPVFVPIRDALPNPPGSNITNGVPGTQFIDGDYAEITVLLESPMAQGTYTPIPYEPELRVLAPGNLVYVIGMWREPGDPVDSNGRPLAFIVPDTYAWPLEGKQIWDVYSGFNDWIDWVNDPGSTEPAIHWYDLEPVKDYFDISLFN